MKLSFLILLSCLFCGHYLLAQPNNPMEFIASKDNTIFEGNNNSNGLGDYFFVGNTNQDQSRRGLIAFQLNIPQLPESGLLIDSVILSLTTSKSLAGSQTFHIHRLTKDWGESSSNASGNEGRGTGASINDATWNHTFFNTATWSTPGGDFEAIPSASFVVNDLKTFQIKSEKLIQDVQLWASNPQQNFGWILIGNEASSGTAYRFVSKDNQTEVKPTLNIYYTFTTNLSNQNPVNTSSIWYNASEQTISSVGKDEVLEWQIFNLNGVEVLKTKGEMAQVQQLAKGLYLVLATTSGKVLSKKVWVH